MNWLEFNAHFECWSAVGRSTLLLAVVQLRNLNPGWYFEAEGSTNNTGYATAQEAIEAAELYLVSRALQS